MPRNQKHVLARSISGRNRAALAAAGLASWLAGGVASFLSANGAGAAALVAAGVVSGVLALVGRWPSRISVSGNEFFWDAVEETVDTQIRAVEASDDLGSALAELTELKERLSVLQRTGSVPEHPAEIYDRNVEAAIRRLLPGAEVVRQGVGSLDVPDFVVRDKKGSLYVETKWRSDPTRPFGGSTLPRLAMHFTGGSKLLVIVNADEETKRAHEIIDELLGPRGRIVKWQDVRDDPELGKALTSLIQTDSQR